MWHRFFQCNYGILQNCDTFVTWRAALSAFFCWAVCFTKPELAWTCCKRKTDLRVSAQMFCCSVVHASSHAIKIRNSETTIYQGQELTVFLECSWLLEYTMMTAPVLMSDWLTQHAWMPTHHCGVVQEHYQREPVWARLLCVPGEWASLQHAELKWASKTNSGTVCNATLTSCKHQWSNCVWIWYQCHSLQLKPHELQTPVKQLCMDLIPVPLHDSLNRLSDWLIDWFEAVPVFVLALAKGVLSGVPHPNAPLFFDL